MWKQRFERRISGLEKAAERTHQYLNDINAVTHAGKMMPVIDKVQATSKFLQSEPCYKNFLLEYTTNITDVSNKILRKAFDLSFVESENMRGQSETRGQLRKESSHGSGQYLRGESCHGSGQYLRGESAKGFNGQKKNSNVSNQSFNI